MASPTLIAFVEADSVQAAPTSITTASLTWQTGDVLVCFGMTEGSHNATTLTISNTGSGLSWLNPIAHASSNDPAVYGWTAVASAGSSGTVTNTLSIGEAVAVGVYQFRAPSGATIAVGTSNLVTDKTTTPFTAAITMSSADSSVCWMMDDWGANLGSAFTASPTPTTHGSSAPGPSASPVGPTQEGSHYTFGIADLDDQVATGSQSFGYTGTGLTSPLVVTAVIEVKISGGASATNARPVFLPLMAPQGM